MDADLASVHHRFEAAHAETATRQERDCERYDAGREAARLSLLEQRSLLAFQQTELTGLENGTLFPSMATTERTVRVSEARTAITEVQTNIDRLTEQAGDEEDVVDQAGRLPRDRRELMLAIFSARRSVEVRELRATVAEIGTSMA